MTESGKSRKKDFKERIDRLFSSVYACSKTVEAELGNLSGIKGELSGIMKELERIRALLTEKKKLSSDKLEEIGDAVEILEEELEAKRKKVKERSTGKEGEYLTALQYQKAELENYKRRTEKEKQEFGEYLIKGFTQDLLPIKDSLEVAIEHAREDENSEGLLKGVEMTVKQINELLKREGLGEIEAEGEQFDPFKHEVVAKEIAEDHPENTVIEVMRKGYMFRGKVIRPAMVKIATKE
ncbi:MAG: nucleotide exchange factor GrpE [Methanosarcinales archaeon]|nr:nucleotide exchange factor GrpE [Methanosarcinales archaeon]